MKSFHSKKLRVEQGGNYAEQNTAEGKDISGDTRMCYV